MIRAASLFAVGLWVLSAGASAQESPPPLRTTPVTGSVVELPRLGVRFEVPPGWSARERDGGYLLASGTIPGRILALAHELSSLDELRAAISAGYTDRELELRLDGEMQPFGDRGLTGAVVGSAEGQPVRGRVIGILSGRGGGVTLVAAAAGSAFGDAQATAVASLAESFEFFAPREPTPLELWREKLTDARLTYMYSYYSSSPDGAYVGASEETIIDLCAPGFFHYGAESSLSADGGFGGRYDISGLDASGRRGSGGWELAARGSGVALRLAFHDGTLQEYTLDTDEEGRTLLNGRRYFRTFTSSPLPEARPDCP